MEYHSALKPEHDAPALDRWEGEAGIALTHDLAAAGSLPLEFDQCDVLYAEPPFRAGWDVFHQRVGREPAVPYQAFIGLCSLLIAERGGVLLLGKHALRYATAPDWTQPVTLHKWDALALWYGLVPDRPTPKTSAEILVRLAEQFDVVGDFCAGYGVAGQVFARAGKRFVLADVNPRCTGYISEHAAEW